MNDTRSLDYLFKLVHCLKRNMQEQIEILGVDISPMHLRVLKIIIAKPSCNAADIASFLQRDKAQVTRLLNQLIRLDLIKKEVNEADKRSQHLCITSGGQELMSQLVDKDKVVFDKMTSSLTNKELDIFENVIRKMTDNLNN